MSRIGSRAVASSDLARLAEQLLFKLRELANQPPLDDLQLQVRGAIWADELIKARIPPRRWDEIATLARKSRASASKGFQITVDQVIDAWEHWLRGNEWSTAAEDWQPTRSGGIHFERRFIAAYELASGREYNTTSADLSSLCDLTCNIDAPTKEDFDSALNKYLAAAANPTLEGFCVSEAFEPIYAARRRQEEERRRAADRREEERRQQEQAIRKREEEDRRRREEQREQEREKWERFCEKLPADSKLRRLCSDEG